MLWRATPMFFYEYASHFRCIRFMIIGFELKYEVLDSENQDLSVFENTFEKSYWRRNYWKIWRVKLIAPSWVLSFDTFSSDHFISLSLDEYPPNPTSSLEYLLRGYDYHLLRSVCDSFDLDSVWCALSRETETIFESIRSSLGKQDHFVCWNS